MAAFPYVVWRAMRAVLPNTPSKISVPFINSALGKNCLVPSPFNVPNRIATRSRSQIKQ
jgi:hypothetical protein